MTNAIQAHLFPDLPALVDADGSNEWYTPRSLVEAVRSFYGQIDLDPASCATAQRVVQARQFYTVADDGLVLEWRGRVWCNPPYARGVIDQWAAKAIAEYEAGRATEVLLLTNTSSSPDWYQACVRSCRAFCFLKRRVNFWNPAKDRPNGNDRDQTLFYFGGRAAAFRAAFDPSWGVVPGASAW